MVDFEELKNRWKHKRQAEFMTVAVTAVICSFLFDGLYVMIGGTSMDFPSELVTIAVIFLLGGIHRQLRILVDLFMMAAVDRQEKQKEHP